jgi:hypothetical protein
MSSQFRYEIKFILNNIDLARAMKWMYQYTSAEENYPKRKVNSLYFDDIYYSSVKDNLSGIAYRDKKRLRWYDSKRTPPVFEIKNKNGRLGSKEKYILNSLDSNFYDLKIEKITSTCFEDLQSQNIFFDRYLLPSMLVSYEREYFETLSGLRITFDNNINFYDPLPSLCLNECNSIPYSNNIMEIKFEPRLKNSVTKLIRNLNMTPKRHSKYLVGLAKLDRAVYI